MDAIGSKSQKMYSIPSGLHDPVVILRKAFPTCAGLTCMRTAGQSRQLQVYGSCQQVKVCLEVRCENRVPRTVAEPKVILTSLSGLLISTRSWTSLPVVGVATI